MDKKDPTICRQFEASDSDDFVLEAIVISVAVVISALLIAGVIDYRRRQLLKRQPLDEEAERDEIHEIEKLTESDNRRVVACRLIIFCMLIAAGIALPIIVNGLLMSRENDEFEAMVRTWLGAIQGMSGRKHTHIFFVRRSFSLSLQMSRTRSLITVNAFTSLPGRWQRLLSITVRRKQVCGQTQI